MASSSIPEAISAAADKVVDSVQAGLAKVSLEPKEGQKKEKKAKPAQAAGPKLELEPQNEFIAEREALFQKYKKISDDFVAAQERVPIQITLPDGAVKEGIAWETTPMDIAKSISQGLADKVIISLVDKKTLHDLNRPLTHSCSLSLLDFDEPSGQARAVFWHSSAHILGEACERHLEGCCLGHGPPTDEGFFYDLRIGDGSRTITQADFPQLDALAKKIVKEKQPFERLELPKEALLEMFKYNKYKQHYISEFVKDGESSTVYKCGPLIDFCLGPHIPHTGKVKSMAIMKNSSSYFKGDAKEDSLQRIYGVSFPDSKAMAAHKAWLEEAEKRNHRKIGVAQKLFIFHELSPGAPFFLPHGMRIKGALVDLIREEYRKRNYSEVESPNMYNVDLWKQSGHYQHYIEDMFSLKVDDTEFALKPMNCPGHCLIFDSEERSYRDLPIRMAEFGILHRNEATGALSGMSRVRRFCQDDAHIFCTVDQIPSEIENLFDFVKTVYDLFGMELKFGLSTRNPKKFVGDLSVWDSAEKTLEEMLEKYQKGKWEVFPEDAAFYGPKIDINVRDALRREHQVATIQLDFQLPERFKLKYRSGSTDADEIEKRPVMIHRAIMGSLERFIANITEHLAGKWPFWLSPRQVVVIPIAVKYNKYAEEIRQMLWNAGLYADTDLTDNTLNKKVRNNELAQYNFIVVVGEKEEQERSVNVRNRDDVGQKVRQEVTIPLDTFKNQLLSLKTERRFENQLL